MRLRIVVTVILVAVVSPSLLAETRFVRGGSGLYSTYAIIERNGVEYRTDEHDPTVNRHLWAELSAADRRAVIAVYDWRIGRRIDDFGQTTSDEMAAWINEEQGWTAAAEALKARHANKEFPTLVPVFGPDAVLEIPDFACVNPDVIASDNYKEALRLQREIGADYAVGRQVYTMLVNAKWDQLSIAVKSISEPLIGIIVDTFITGIITGAAGGASKASELAVQAYNYAMELKEMVEGRLATGSKPPTPAELIARLEQYIDDMETTANTAVVLIQTKKERLTTLATALKALDAERTAAKQDAALALRASLLARTQVVPAPAIPPDFEPRNPGATQAEQDADVKAQAEAWLQANVIGPRDALLVTKTNAVNDVRAAYWSLVSNGFWIGYPGSQYMPDASDAFIRPYFEVVDPIATAQRLLATDLPNARSDLQAKRDKLANALADVNAVLDAQLPQIELLHARSRGMDAYAPVLGYTPSTTISFATARDYSSLIEVAATPDKTAEEISNAYDDYDGLADELQSTLPTGVAKRNHWIAAEARKYDNIRFNWENSISYVIALNRQLDRLHAGPYFKLHDLIPPTCYSLACVYTYAVDVAAINAAVAAEPTRAARERARLDAVKELSRLRAEEDRLILRLEIAQRSHINDRADLERFFNSLYARYGGSSMDEIRADFAAAGYPLETQTMLYEKLVPDITYYGFGDTWIRNRSRLQTDLRSAIGKVSGKIPTYYELLNLYQSMKVEKSRYLAMTLSEFDAFMTATTIKLMTNGTYQTAFRSAGVFGVEWPCWQLIMKTQRRQDELNAEYRGYPPPPVYAWDIEGIVTTTGASAVGGDLGGVATHSSIAGIGVPNVDVLLEGYLTATARSDSAGRFRFTWIGTGDFTLIASGGAYLYPQPTNNVTIVTSDTTTSFAATETAESGHFVIGRVTDAAGTAVSGVTISLTSSAGEVLEVTAADGTYRFVCVAQGEIVVRPISGTHDFTPAIRTATVYGSLTGVDFQAAASTSEEPGLSVTITGTGTVTSSPAGIQCPPVCFAAFAQGSVVALSAAAEDDAAFSGWYGRCAGTGPCSVTMDDVRIVGAAFGSTAPDDTVPPVITTFSVPATSSSLTIPVTFIASDNVGLTGYLVADDAAQPAVGDGRWTASAPSSFSVGRSGLTTLYGWAKDAAGNMTASSPKVVDVTVTAFSGAAPTDLTATMIVSPRVSLSWAPVDGATYYVIERMAPGTSFQVIANAGSTSYTDTTSTSGTAYLYRVKASGDGTFSGYSLPDLACTLAFDDSPLTAGMFVRAVHLSQLRSGVAAVRQLAGLGAYPFSDSPVAGVPIRAVHVTEMRSALEQACSLLGLSGYSYLDGSLDGIHVKATHFQQLRDRLQ